MCVCVYVLFVYVYIYTNIEAFGHINRQPFGHKAVSLDEIHVAGQGWLLQAYILWHLVSPVHGAHTQCT